MHNQKADNFRGLYRRLIDLIHLTYTHTHTMGMTAGYIMNTVIEGNISDGSSMLILNNHSLISLFAALSRPSLSPTPRFIDGMKIKAAKRTN